MKLRRSLFATGAPVALGLICAGSAFAAVPPVTVRVEGKTRTLLQAKSVTAPAHGSITKGGAPAGTCPADSAAGALNVATHGRWRADYDSSFGLFVTGILGTTLHNDRVAYWEFFVNDRAASEGVCDTRLHRGDSLLFAAVPAKGRAELPIVMRAPKRTTAGRSFVVRTFVYTGKGKATKPVKAHFAVKRAGGSGGVPKLRVAASRHGVTQLTLRAAGRFRVVASAKGDIRSAATTIKVAG